MSFLPNLSWRYATKKFIAGQHVPEKDVESIIEAIRLAPTSFGLQPLHVIVISNSDVLAKLSEKSFNKNQLATCSHLFVFCARTDIMEVINERMVLVSGNDIEMRLKMKAYEDMLTGFAKMLDSQSVLSWTSNQTYIALGFGLAACAELKIDAAPMEGFEHAGFREVLNIPASMEPVVMMAIGYRSSDDVAPPKVRFRKEDLFTFEK